MARSFSIHIDGNNLIAFAGETILDTARRNGIEIPTLCTYEGTANTGACRMCVVEVAGTPILSAACVTPAAPGMIVATDSPRVRAARRLSLQLLWESGSHDCLTCESNGACELQNLLYRMEIETPRFQADPPRFTAEETNTMIRRDMNRCILCGRCIRACNEIQVNNVLEFSLRGADTIVGPAFNNDYIDSECVFCGECIDACPVGAITARQARFKGQPWERTQVRTTCPYCGVGCQCILHVRHGEVIDVTGYRKTDTPNRGSLCAKGRFGMEFISHHDRLKTPLIRVGGTFRETSWEEALSFIARRLDGIRTAHGPDSIAGLSSAKCTNEENFLFQKFMRAVIGTNNVDHCARLCHATSVTGLADAFGSGAMTNSIEEIEKAAVILATGTNTTETHPVIGAFIKRAVRRNGAKLIVIDPRKIGLTAHAELWLRQTPGTDVAVINGLVRVIIDENLHDKTYIQARTEAFDVLKKAVDPYTPAYVERVSGVSAAALVEAARLYATAPSAAIFYAMGITQHTTGTDNVKALANLAMLCGNVGIEGGGVNPLRGQNNVQGACDMGALPNVLSGYAPVTDGGARTPFESAWGVTLPPTPGLTVVEMINAAFDGTLKALYVMGENPLLSDPDITHVESALGNLDLLIVQDIFLTETAHLAHVVLPSACFAEKEGTFTNTERRVQRVRKAVEPPSDALPDWKIISRLSAAMGTPMEYRNAQEIMDEINDLTPSYGGITYKRIERRGLSWPCPHEKHPGTKVLHRDRFTRGRGRFHAVHYQPAAEVPDSQYPFILTTGRVLYHYHTGTLSRRARGLCERFPENLIEINPADAKQKGIKTGTTVTVTSRRGSVTVTASVTDTVPPGTVFMNFHFCEAAVNRLTNPALDPVGKIPEFKVCAVNLARQQK